MKDEALKLAKECGATTYTNRHYPEATAVTFSPMAWEKFCEQAIAAPVQEPVCKECDDSGEIETGIGMMACTDCPPSAQPAPVQEPMGVFVEDDDIGHVRLIPHQQMKLKDGDKLYTTPPAAQRQWVGLETLIPEGWRFYTADFSMQATGKRNCGSVMLIRDEKGVAEWHKLPDDLKESDDGPPLYLSGTGKTLQEAIKKASARAIEFSLKEKNNGN
jgi:hypothetical protein